MLTTADINPNALYDVKQVAELLSTENHRMHRDSVYEIPEHDLKPTWVGPRRGRKKFMGSAIIAYLEAGQ